MTLAVYSAAAIWLIWFGYPLVIAGLAALRRPRLPVPLALPTVTVVIATRDDPSVVRRRVADALAANYPAEKLSVVVGLDAGGSRTAPADLASFGERVVAVPGDPPGGKAATLNAAVRAARGDVLVFTDAGQTFDPMVIRRLSDALATPGIGAASGRLEIPAGKDGPSLSERYWRYERWIRRSEARVHSTVGVTGAIYAMPRALWGPLPAGLILDDLYVPMRLVLAGRRIAFVDDARATDTRRFDAQQEFRRKARTLTGVIQLCVWLPGVLVPFRNPVWLQFVFHKLLRLLTPYLLVLGAVGAVWGAVTMLPGAVVGGAALAAAVVVGALLATPRLGRRLRAAAVQGAALQGAVVVAAFNGLRGRWDVWQR
jgi:cellulose synthase/poly-beta-1,6-N-acetylglucosamine synthase-like glycosyltransferase